MASSAQQPPAKKARTATNTNSATYELLYHPKIPGRGEFARLLLEASGTAYVDVANADPENGYSRVQAACTDPAALTSGDNQPPVFAPPALRVTYDDGKDGEAMIISQTPNILAFLGEKTGLDGGEGEKWHVAQVALTALDLNNEAHDTHHPLAVMKYYEEQKEAALVKAADFRENRLPKYFGYFSRVLKYNNNDRKGKGGYLVGPGLTYADSTVWQVLDGLFFAFPKEMEARKGEFPELLDGFYNEVKGLEWMKGYLGSERRMEYSMGVFRHYPELDRQ